jgi:putative nucleotidyltransferase with HDIG domain
MKYAHRTFLWSIAPFTMLLVGIFGAVQQSVSSTVRQGLRNSLREKQAAVASLERRAAARYSRALRAVAESAALKAGLQLVLHDGGKAARLTLEDQLREICESIGVDFLLISDLNGAPLAGMMRDGDRFSGMDPASIETPTSEYLLHGGHIYRVTSIPVNQAEENIATLSVGERFELSEFNAPVALMRSGRVIAANLPGFSLRELESGLRNCGRNSECEFSLRNETYLSEVLENVRFGNGYALRSLQNVDRAVSPVQQVLRRIFVNSGLCALLAAIGLTAVSARSIVQPIAQVVAQLRNSAGSGLPPEFSACASPVREIRELMASFNDAAGAIRNGREELSRAYVEFIGSLASALDARDPYTAGHSLRVSEYSLAIARRLNLPPQQVDEIRVGALLHDIGKIGIADSVLQKPGGLTEEEFALIRQHPVIGRKILEGVHGLAPYLAIVELHHENWDGSGYPYGQRGQETPLGARIVHVADAYDAMTSDRPYRRGMRREEALRALIRNAGVQFDPVVVNVFAESLGDGGDARPRENVSLANLARAIRGEPVAAAQEASRLS